MSFEGIHAPEEASKMKNYIHIDHGCPNCEESWFFVIKKEEGVGFADWFLKCFGCKSKLDARSMMALAQETLQNGNFEGGFSERGAGEIDVADGWYQWTSGHAYWKGKLARPEWKPESRTTGKGRVHGGQYAQKQFTTYALQNAGLEQKVKVEKDAWYHFHGFCYVWASEDDNPDVSRGGRMHCALGVNQWGEWPDHPATIYGKEVEQHQYNKWTHVEVFFQAWKNEANLILRALGEFAAKHNDVYWDDMRLDKIELGGAEPAPPPAQPDECGLTKARYAELVNNQAEIALGLANISEALGQIPKRGDKITL